MKVVDFLQPDCVIPQIQGTDKAEVLPWMANFLASRHTGIDPVLLYQLIEEREALASTAIGDGLAIPHGKLETVDHLVGVLGRSVSGLSFDSIDGKPTHLVFMLVAPANAAGVHLNALARLSKVFRDAAFRQRLIEAVDGDEMYRVIAEEDAKY
jgi:PTS system nitrogen regulatory IIA component